MDARQRGVAFAVLSAAGFGTLAIFGRFAARAGIPIQTLLAYRFLLAAPLVWALLSWRGRLRLLRGRPLALALALGVVGYAAMSGLFLWGVELTSAGLAGILLYVYPAIVLVFAVSFLDERVTRRTVLAVAVALVGVAFVSGGQPTGVNPLGVGVLLLAAVVYAAYITLSRVVLDEIEATTLTAYVIPGAGLTFLAYSLASGQARVPATPTQWGIVAGIAVLATAVPILSFFLAIEAIGASRTSVVSTFEPVFTVALGALLLGEAVTPATVVGGVAVLAGVVLVESELE